MRKSTINDAVQFAVSEMNKSEKTKTHEVICDNNVEFQGTKDACAIYIAANDVFYKILGKTMKVRKIK